MASCPPDKGVSRRRMASPAACGLMVRETSAHACRIRSAVGLSVLFVLWSGCTPGHVVGACCRDRRRTHSMPVTTRTPSVSRSVRPSRGSLRLPPSGAIGPRLLRRLPRRSRRSAWRAPHTASGTDRRCGPALGTKACQPNRGVRGAMGSSWRARRVLWARMGVRTRVGRLAAPRPRPPEWVGRARGVSPAPLCTPATRGAVSPWSLAAQRVASAGL